MRRPVSPAGAYPSSAPLQGSLEDCKIIPMRVVGVIPARYASSRLEGKALAGIHGKPMIQHVWERCRGVPAIDQLLVATDDVRIQQAVELFGGEAVMTDPEHASGTDRVAEAVENVDCDVVVNIQGDEPMLDPLMIDELVEPFRRNAATEMVTLKQLIREEEELTDQNVVKVVTDIRGDALYFSRSLIPCLSSRAEDFRAYKHLGLYSYSKSCLQKLSSLSPTPLERIERLEQLRALENGVRIRVVLTRSEGRGVSVDTPEDLETARRLMSGV